MLCVNLYPQIANEKKTFVGDVNLITLKCLLDVHWMLGGCSVDVCGVFVNRLVIELLLRKIVTS